VPYANEEYASAGRAILCHVLISAAKVGERDPRWLADNALLYLSQQKLNRTPPNALPTSAPDRHLSRFYGVLTTVANQFRCCSRSRPNADIELR
jgi:hypothetical protein